MRFSGESPAISAAAPRQHKGQERREREQRQERARVRTAALVARLGAGGHGELLRGQNVVGLVDARGVRRQALVSGSDAELVGRQDVVRLVDPAGIAGVR